ncbi:MAG: DNA mismatch repair protein [Algoriphagus sp.]|uniref:MutS-related protein n=1 Tax=Algoriphagus sp. TaxID=1872435 RepID=UPI00181A71BF|nr:DNA mismatch repair protein [Algoriphagus sp.]NVJ87237.1 DNA mismatch repair protein [Algoriphagus sp.]
MKKNFDFLPIDLPQKQQALRKTIGVYSLVRLVLFVFLGAFVVLFFSDAFYWIIPAGLFIWAFVGAIQKHLFLKDQGAIFQALDQIQKESAYRSNRALGLLDSGKEYLEKNHPFCNDLDLFGDHSLFQLLNHTHSEAARKKLADRLKSKLDLKKGFEAHGAILELAKKEDFLRSFEAIGKALYDKKESGSDWSEWMGQSISSKSYLKPVGWIGVLGGTVLGVSAYLNLIPSAFLGLWIVLGLPFLALIFKELKEAGDRIPSAAVLKTYKNWLLLLESQEFEHSILKNQKSRLSLPEGPLSSELLEELDRLSLWIQNRLNLLYIPLNLFFWTDLLIYSRWVRWKNQWGKTIAQFPEQLAEWEVLVSLAIFEKEEARQASIRISEEMKLLAKEISHPLLQPQKAVPNDFEMNPDGKLVLLTGANMSGKTTFMRSLGINLVLVNLGLSPFADSMVLGDFQLYTSMRNADNLGESISSFYAELSRIKGLIDRLESGERIFFLLDEILKGTNTEDRIAGSEALIRQLESRQFLGIISTHDIELSRLEGSISYVRNYSFHSEVKADTIDFDYRIKRGPCPSFNAHKLMELMGIRFDSES